MVTQAFGVAGVLFVLGGSVWQALEDIRSWRQISSDHLTYEELAKQAKRLHPWWARKQRKQEVLALRSIWTSEGHREYRRVTRGAQAWIAIVIGTIYSLIVSIATT